MRGGRRSTSIRPGEVRNPHGKNQYAPGAAAASKKAVADLKALAKEFTEEALMRIVSIMRNDNVPPNTQLSAAFHVLDRGHGKPREIAEVKAEVTLEDLILAAARRREELAQHAEDEKLH